MKIVKISKSLILFLDSPALKKSYGFYNQPLQTNEFQGTHQSQANEAFASGGFQLQTKHTF